jgi:ChrR Cupin-like domain
MIANDQLAYAVMAMQLNSDFSQRVSMHAAHMPWIRSPSAGVERRMLDRIGDEVARATSIVRYAPHSSFPPHTHGGGEEFLVLEGVFQDEDGDYPVGAYVRNPPTSIHSPRSVSGCTIFVKLWQFDAEDRTQVRIDTSNTSYLPAHDRPGVEVMSLFHDESEDVRLECWAPGTDVSLDSPGGAEIFVLKGGFEENAEHFERHSWLRLPCHSVLRATADSTGCKVWLKTGHLSEPQRSMNG